VNYGEVKTDFQKKLNRRDITPSQVESFVRGAIQRAQRLLRVPASESIVEDTIEEGFEILSVPGDFLKMVSFSINGQELTRRDLSTVHRLAKTPGIPRHFCRDGDVFRVGPLPYAGDTLRLVFSADFSALNADVDTNFLTEIAPDIITDGAMSAACRHYSDPRGQAYEDSFVKGIVDLNNQAAEDELTNAQITPAYSFDFDE